MKQYTQPSHAISGVFVFLLLGIFAVFSTVMVLLGARAYRGTADRLEKHNAARIAAAYIRSMVRAEDEQDAVRVEEINGISMLSLLDEYDEEAYVTRLYCYDGMLREWFTDEDREFVPEEGDAVCACDGLSASLQPGLLRVELLHGEEWTAVYFALRALQ